MIDKEFERLALKKICDQLSNHEDMRLNSYLLDKEKQKEFNEIKQLWLSIDDYNQVYSKSVPKNWDQLERKYSFNSAKFSFFKPLISAVVFLIAVLTFLFNLNIDVSYSTSLGEQKEIILPDESHVILNSNSLLTYTNKRFFNSKRAVHLSGEAYFEVKRKRDEPFQIKTFDAITTVVGTKFNLKARKNFTQLFVKEGKVKFKSLTRKMDVMIEANESINSLDSLKPIRYEPKFIWKKNYISFKSILLSNILNELKFYYEFDFKLIDVNPVVSANFKLNNSVEDIIRSLSSALDLKVTIENNIFVFTREK